MIAITTVKKIHPKENGQRNKTRLSTLNDSIGKESVDERSDRMSPNYHYLPQVGEQLTEQLLEQRT